MKRMNFIIACLRLQKSMKLGIFTGSCAVDSREMYKKARVKVLFCLVKLLLIWLSLRRRILGSVYMEVGDPR